MSGTATIHPVVRRAFDASTRYVIEWLGCGHEVWFDVFAGIYTAAERRRCGACGTGRTACPGAHPMCGRGPCLVRQAQPWRR